MVISKFQKQILRIIGIMCAKNSKNMFTFVEVKVIYRRQLVLFRRHSVYSQLEKQILELLSELKRHT